MAWGYWSATSVLPDRGRSPRRQTGTAAVPVAATPSTPGGGSEPAEPTEPALSAAGSSSSGEAEELPSRRVSPQRALSVVLCGPGRSDSLRRRYIPDERELLADPHECYVHAHPTYVQCRIHDRERIRRTTDGLSDSEEESSDPGYASGIKMFTLCSDNDEEGSEPCYESGTHIFQKGSL